MYFIKFLLDTCNRNVFVTWTNISKYVEYITDHHIGRANHISWWHKLSIKCNQVVNFCKRLVDIYIVSDINLLRSFTSYLKPFMILKDHLCIINEWKAGKHIFNTKGSVMSFKIGFGSYQACKYGPCMIDFLNVKSWKFICFKWNYSIS